MTHHRPRLKSGKKIAIVVCPNFDKWHGENLFVAYIITDKKIYDEPDFEMANSLIKWHPHLDLQLHYRTCMYCRRRLRCISNP